MILVIECGDKELLDIVVDRAKELYKKNREPVSPMITRLSLDRISDKNIYTNMFYKLFGQEDIKVDMTAEYFKRQNDNFCILYVTKDTFEDRVVIQTIKRFGLNLFVANEYNFDIAINMIKRIYFGGKK